ASCARARATGLTRQATTSTSPVMTCLRGGGWELTVPVLVCDFGQHVRKEAFWVSAMIGRAGRGRGEGFDGFAGAFAPYPCRIICERAGALRYLSQRLF